MYVPNFWLELDTQMVATADADSESESAWGADSVI
jgi:hypothetical protein